MQGVTAEYGPARAQKNQTGKWYPQIPVDHTTLQINQRVVNTTLIPVKYTAGSVLISIVDPRDAFLLSEADPS